MAFDLINIIEYIERQKERTWEITLQRKYEIKFDSWDATIIEKEERRFQ
jgi:hypothetical protein